MSNGGPKTILAPRTSLQAVSWPALLVAAVVGARGAEFAPSSLRPPAVQRELRGAWVASVKNIDWPSKPGLSAAQQQAELVAILDRCAQLHLNAVFFQVRPACDALYESALEPWSECLTGTMGRAPGYDPLGFAIRESHWRGLELHAWFNPFRARRSGATGAVARDHISRTRPSLVKSYGASLWLDPGERDVQDHSLRVVLDVVRRYDVDGVHFDDYFYPYEEKDRQGRAIPFPDDSSWKRYQTSGGRLDREDWRRENVNRFVRQMQNAVHAQKPWVKFGISPFGIWRPGHPPSVKGLDAYDSLYADSRRWLAEGWVDYLAPQLYWPANAPEQSFPALLKWWTEQNARQRHVWAGVSHRNGMEEIVRQIHLTRKQPGANGEIHWSVKALGNGQRGEADALRREVYGEPALTPAFPWLDNTPPAQPGLSVTAGSRGGTKANWSNNGAEAVWLWVLQTRNGGAWRTEILAAAQTSREWTGKETPEALALTAVDRCGNPSPPVVLEKQPDAPPRR
ncbi:MAG TPA: family 10 glycosylhydrolase [Verrucomicrobiae bacterium]|nr:family 10 glycosylhydrolase [Verrucomicrobiae bacterium]